MKEKIKTKFTKSKKVEPSPVVKNKPTIEEKIYEKVAHLCDRNPNLYLLYIDDNFALIVKKKVRNVVKVINPNSMQPHEKSLDMTFFDTFIIEWGTPGAKYDVFGKLVEEMKLPSYKVYSPDRADIVIEDA